MLLKLYKITKLEVFKRIKTPKKPNIICETYKCPISDAYTGNATCKRCSKINELIFQQYNDSWDTINSYTCKKIKD